MKCLLLLFRRKLSLQRNVSFSRTKIDWTPEKGYADDSSRNAYPWRAFGTGASMGLSIVLDAALHDYYCSSTASGGFKVSQIDYNLYFLFFFQLFPFQILLHNPIETPKISEFAFFLSPGFETRVEIWPMIGSSTSSLLSIPQVRPVSIRKRK